MSGHPGLEKYRIWTLRVQDGERLWACLASKSPWAIICKQDVEFAGYIVRSGHASGLTLLLYLVGGAQSTTSGLVFSVNRTRKTRQRCEEGYCSGRY